MTPKSPTQMPPGTLSDNVGKHDEHPVNDAGDEPDADDRGSRSERRRAADDDSDD